jgi:GDP-mannose 6-dehydrogenase
VAVIGLGYVGCVTAACLAKLGHRAIGVDRDTFKVDQVNQGEAPFYEPGLPELVKGGAQNGTLSATTSMSEALEKATVAMICVGTPSERNGNLGLDQLRRVCEEIGALAKGRSLPLVVAVRSTVFPGTCEDVVMPLVGDSVKVVSNPEFLREGSAVKDFEDPTIIVVGGESKEGVAAVCNLYAPLGIEPCAVSLRTAEMIKYACNAFHAVKISFANEIGTLAEQVGVDPFEVMGTLCKDVRLNVSAAYLKPGFAFGGSCLPKDLRALTYRSRQLDVKLPMLESVLSSNDEHLRRVIDAALALPAKRLGIFGLAFKENTDDLRESPVVTLVEQLIAKGRNLRIFDPHIDLTQIYGSNLNFLLSSLPHVGRLLTRSMADMLDGADYLIIAQKPSAALLAELKATKLPILDATQIVPSRH